MKKFLALMMTVFMSANLVLSVYAGDDVGGVAKIDYDDIVAAQDYESDAQVETDTTEITTTESVTETTTTSVAKSANKIVKYVWNLSADRTKDTTEYGLKFATGDFTTGGGAKIDGVQYTSSLTAEVNGAGIEFTPASDGQFTVAYKVSKGKTAYVCGETVPNKTGGSLYKISTVNVEKGKTYKAYVAGSKIQIYYLEFAREQADGEETSEVTTESVTETTTASTVDWPATEDATYWNFSDTKYADGLVAGDNDGLVVGEKMSIKSSTSYSAAWGKYVQGSANPTVKNRVPSAGSYFAFTAPTDGTFYVQLGLGAGKTSYVCNSNVYNSGSTDSIYENAYKLEAGKTYYIYSLASKIKAYKFAFVSGGTEGESTEVTQGIFTVTDGDNNVTQCMTLLEAVTAANGKTATITLNEDYYVNSKDAANDDNSYKYGDGRRSPLLSGSNTNVTLVSNGKRHSIIRDTSDYVRTITVTANPYYSYTETYVLENFLVVQDGATLNVGSTNYNDAVIFDGGFKYDFENQKLNPVIDGADKSSEFGAFIGINGGKIVLNNKVSFVRNYSVNHSAAWKPVEYATINPLGSGSEIEINGADFAYNHGLGILCANKDCKITINKTDIYYNETVGKKGAISLADSSDNLVFTPKSDAQIRSNKNYDETSNELSNYLSDIYTSTAIYLDGSVEIGELCLIGPQIPVYFKETDRHKNTIAISAYWYSLGSSELNINVEIPADSEYANEEQMVKYDPCIIVKSNTGYYYRMRAASISDGATGSTKFIKFSNIYRDVIIYRENNSIGEDSARYGFVVAGAFSWGYADAEREEAEKKKWNAVGFDVVSSEDENFDPTSAEPLFVNTGVAYYNGFVWGNDTIAPAEDTVYDNPYFMENPITGWALDGRCSPVLNGDMQESAYWADHAKGVFGFEVKNLSANIKFYVRKHYVASDENTDGDYITDWIFVNTPSLYTTSYADIVSE